MCIFSSTFVHFASKIKAYMRKLKARTKDALQKALTEALDNISPADVLAWFAEFGYSK